MVSIITINYNGAFVTKRLLDSLNEALTGVDYEVIVVDNNSSEEDKNCLRSVAKENVKIVYNSENSGFAAGNNIGIENSSGDYIMLLNNDTVAKNDFITPLVDFLECNVNVGIACSRIMSLENSSVIQFGGYSPVGKYMIDIKSAYNNCENTCVVSGDVKTPFAHGAAMMFRRSSLYKTGMMPLDYFLYFEELDWSMSFTSAGYEIWCVSGSMIYHEGSHSMGGVLPLKIYYNTRNRLVFAARNLKGIYRIGNIFFQLFISVPKNGFKFLLKGNPTLFKAVFCGAFDFIAGKRGRKS